jgi:hypothetical protein
MVSENGASIAAAEYVNVGKWNDPEQLADWIGEWTFEDTPGGPYLLSTLIGRETTGAASVRHILGWVRIERDRLVPERFEAYDVPLGQRREAAHLTVTATPEKPVERALDGTGPRLPDLKNTTEHDQKAIESSDLAPSASISIPKSNNQGGVSGSHGRIIWIVLLGVAGIVLIVGALRAKSRRNHE